MVYRQMVLCCIDCVFWTVSFVILSLLVGRNPMSSMTTNRFLISFSFRGFFGLFLLAQTMKKMQMTMMTVSLRFRRSWVLDLTSREG
ncbi:hypothetical protein M8C21_020699 [Ambrosia artemisiifolia]|uniref:Uncharacterized protein n=1 Tax=Ambrosia artemisiifolia TaxID=4212 RepID=A0AAD5DB28_AMBAR|nr:hypothetical protein M8C21_020699 [Ambrosia artemisiifolia]